jgi:sensor histidine kinase YesM
MKNKWFFYCLHLLFWAFTSWLIISSFSITGHMVNIENGIVSDTISRSDELIWFFSIGQPFFALYFYLQIFLTKKRVKQKKLIALAWQSLLLTGLFYILYMAVVYFIFPKHIHILWFPSLWYGIFIFYIIISISYGFIHAWIQTEKDKKQLEISTKKAELNLLRAQLHPHFLFNTMNNLLAMVDQQHNPKLAKSIDTLSSLLRYVVYENKEPKVTVAKEIRFVKDFVALHLLRYEEDEIDYKITTTGQYNQQLIEMSILLSFVENAFKHGVQPELDSFIHITIDISKNNRILFAIENSKHPKLSNEQIGGYGIQSTKDRLQLAYPNKHQLNIKENNTTYSTTLNLQTDESNLS